MAILESNPIVSNCRFISNSANAIFLGACGGGGAINRFSSKTLFTHCTFSGNEAVVGGGISNDGSSPIIINCTFCGNLGAGIGNWWSDSKPIITNSILWNESEEIWNFTEGPIVSINYSNVRSG